MPSSYQLENVLFHYLQVFFILHFKILKRKKTAESADKCGYRPRKKWEEGRGRQSNICFPGGGRRKRTDADLTIMKLP
jgi:hypothetical protein